MNDFTKILVERIESGAAAFRINGVYGEYAFFRVPSRIPKVDAIAVSNGDRLHTFCYLPDGKIVGASMLSELDKEFFSRKQEEVRLFAREIREQIHAAIVDEWLSKMSNDELIPDLFYRSVIADSVHVTVQEVRDGVPPFTFLREIREPEAVVRYLMDKRGVLSRAIASIKNDEFGVTYLKHRYFAWRVRTARARVAHAQFFSSPKFF